MNEVAVDSTTTPRSKVMRADLCCGAPSINFESYRIPIRRWQANLGPEDSRCVFRTKRVVLSCFLGVDSERDFRPAMVLSKAKWLALYSREILAEVCLLPCNAWRFCRVLSACIRRVYSTYTFYSLARLLGQSFLTGRTRGEHGRFAIHRFVMGILCNQPFALFEFWFHNPKVASSGESNTNCRKHFGMQKEGMHPYS